MDIDIIKVCSKNDFLYFLCELKEDFYTDYEHWQNENVGSYLEAIVAWLQVCERLDADDQKYIFSNMRLIDWNTALNIVASSPEFVGEIRFREFAKLVI